MRVSGPETRTLLGRLGPFASLEPRHSTLVTLSDPQSGERIDQCLVSWFPGPASYTGEDLCEISCHGSPVIVAKILDSLLWLGARLAEPGEFTLRAFLNGKMDLTQAEAVRDLVEARTHYQATVAREQLGGRLSARLQPIKQGLIEVVAFLETAVEFVEDDVGEISRSHQADRLAHLARELETMADTYRYGRFVHDGFRLAIIGRPNVGKSSLFNALLESERAIVTDLPGTTRDAISEHLQVGGIPVRLTDTAGIREAQDRVEQIGIERSRQAAAEADVLLIVLDASMPLCADDTRLLDGVGEQPAIVVWNKIDLVGDGSRPPAARGCSGGSTALTSVPRKTVEPVASPAVEEFPVSALTGQGIENLRNGISRLLGGGASESHGILVTNLRHHDCMRRACASLREGAAALHGNLSEEFALYHIRNGLHTLGQITGETAVEDILDKIFSTFCIGK